MQVPLFSSFRLRILCRLDSLNILIPVQLVVVDILDDAVWQEVFDAHPSSHKEPDFCGRDIVVDELFDDDHIPSIRQLEPSQPQVGTGRNIPMVV